MDIDVLNRTLLTVDDDIEACDGWDEPDHLYTLRGSADEPEVEYLDIPGSVTELLPALLELGIQTSSGVWGLVLVTTRGESLEYREALERPLMANMRQLSRELSDEASIPTEVVAGYLYRSWDLLRQQPKRPTDLERRVRAVMGVLADGVTSVVVREQGGEWFITPQLPDLHGDHAQVVELLRRLMGAPRRWSDIRDQHVTAAGPDAVAASKIRLLRSAS